MTEAVHLGHSPLANRLLRGPEVVAQSFPLALVECTSCGLVQQAVSFETDTLFGRDYPYLSSVSEAVRRNASDLAQRAVQIHETAGTALDVGSNDGVTQKAFAKLGIPCFGVDPAQAAVSQAIAHGCKAHCGAFDEAAVRIVQDEMGGPVDIVTMSNVLAHVPDPRSLLLAARHALAPGGLLGIEFQSWRSLVDLGAFDMIYHEHHSHFSLSSALHLLERCGFGAVEVQETTAQGGSLRLWARMNRDHDAKLVALAADEGAALEGATHRLQNKISHFQISARAFAEAMVGRHVVGYGAAAKTVTVLASCPVDLHLRCIADGAPTKIGQVLPIGGIPILSPEQMIATAPDVIVLFAWNLAEEILPKLHGIEVWTPMPAFRRVQ